MAKVIVKGLFMPRGRSKRSSRRTSQEVSLDDVVIGGKGSAKRTPRRASLTRSSKRASGDESPLVTLENSPKQRRKGDLRSLKGSIAQRAKQVANPRQVVSVETKSQNTVKDDSPKRTPAAGACTPRKRKRIAKASSSTRKSPAKSAKEKKAATPRKPREQEPKAPASDTESDSDSDGDHAASEAKESLLDIFDTTPHSGPVKRKKSAARRGRREYWVLVDEKAPNPSGSGLISFPGLRINEDIVRNSEHVFLRPPPSEKVPYICKVLDVKVPLKCLEKDVEEYEGFQMRKIKKVDGCFFTGKWYCRPHDCWLRHSRIKVADRQEVLTTDASDDNPMEAVLAGCVVVEPHEIENWAEFRLREDDHFFYYRKFIPPTKETKTGKTEQVCDPPMQTKLHDSYRTSTNIEKYELGGSTAAEDLFTPEAEVPSAAASAATGTANGANNVQGALPSFIGASSRQREQSSKSGEDGVPLVQISRKGTLGMGALKSSMQSFVDYFSTHGGSSRAGGGGSGASLSQLKSRIRDDEVRRVITGVPDRNTQRRLQLSRFHRSQFDRWKAELDSPNCNLLFYGVGSKRTVVESFVRFSITNGARVIVNGFQSHVTVKHVLDSITEGCLGSTYVFRTIEDQLEYIRRVLKRNRDLCSDPSDVVDTTSSPLSDVFANLCKSAGDDNASEEEETSESSDDEGGEAGTSGDEDDEATDENGGDGHRLRRRKASTYNESELLKRAGLGRFTRTTDVLLHWNPKTDPLDCPRAADRFRGMVEMLKTGSESASVQTLRPYQTIYLVVHNIDGPALRVDAAQRVLASLARIPGIKLIATVDHVNYSLLQSSQRAAGFHFAFHDLSTFESYGDECSVESSLPSADSGVHGHEGALHVLNGLTPNQREVFRVVCEMSKERSERNGDDDDIATRRSTGVPLHECFMECRSRFLATSDVVFREQLNEFLDHRLLQTRVGADGIEYVAVTLAGPGLEQLLEKLG